MEVDAGWRRGTPKRHHKSPSRAAIDVDGVRRRRRRPATEQDQENLRTEAATCADREPQRGGKTRWLPRVTSTSSHLACSSISGLWHACGKRCTTIPLLLALRASLHFILSCSTISLELVCCLPSGTCAASGPGPAQRHHVVMHFLLSPPWGNGVARNLRREAMEVDAVWRKRTPTMQKESLRTEAPDVDGVWMCEGGGCRQGGRKTSRGSVSVHGRGCPGRRKDEKIARPDLYTPLG